MNKGYELFLLMFTLSCVGDKDKVLKLFLESIQDIFPKVKFYFKKNLDFTEKKYEKIEIRDFKFGYIVIDNSEYLENEDIILISNAVQMLAVLLERFELYEKIQRENVELSSKVFEEEIKLRKKVEELEVLKENQAKLIEKLSLEIVRRKETEEALEKNSAMLDYLLNTVPVYIFWKDVNGTYLGCNKNFANIVGKSDPNEIVGLTDYDLTWTDEDTRGYLKDDAEVIKNKKPKLQIEERLRKFDGEELWISTSKVPMIDSSGEVVGVLGVFDDISDRKKIEEELKRTTHQYQTLVETMNEGLIILDNDRKIIFVNNALCKILEYDKEEIINKKDYYSIIFPADLDFIKEKIKKRKAGISDEYEVRVVTKSNKVKWVSVNASPMYNPEGVIIGSFGLVRDITLTKKITSALEKSEFKFRTLVQNSLEAILILSLDGKILFTNNSALKLIEAPDNFSLIGMSVFDVLAEKSAQEAAQDFRNVATGFDSYLAEYKCKTFTGKEIWVESIGKLIEYEGQPASLVSLRDITERKIYQEELIKALQRADESDKLKSAFLANMSHEIRTPMNGILGFAELLLEQDLDKYKQRHYIEMIEKSGRRMLNLINDIIDISKIEAGLMKLYYTHSNINEQIEYIYKFFKPEIDSKNLSFYTKLSLNNDEAVIVCDKEKLYAIFTNLVKNAIKFTHHGFIEVGYTLKYYGNNNDKYLEFYVKDTGIGIPQHRQNAIFERFIQADIEDQQAYQGTGLGLAITKEYVEMMGGKIWVESIEGKGSCFYFTLPYKTYSPEEINKQVDVKDEAKLYFSDELKILIAEDDEVSLSLLELLFSKSNVKLFKCKTGIDTINTIKNNPDIDLILMDIKMPSINGYDATKKIREFNKDVIIIAQTAYGLISEKEKALECGCNDYIAKPIKKYELFNLIGKYVKNKKM